MVIAMRFCASAGFWRSHSTFGTTPNIAPPSRRNGVSGRTASSNRPKFRRMFSPMLSWVLSWRVE